MPVDFLTEAQQRRYGRYPEEVSAAQLARFFHLDDTARDLIGQRRGDANRLGFALQLLTVRFLGSFLPNPVAVPVPVVEHVARQLGIAEVALSVRATWSASRRATRTAPRSARTTVTATSVNRPGPFGSTRWLFLRAWLSEERPSLLFDLATAWLIERKVLAARCHDPDPSGRPRP